MDARFDRTAKKLLNLYLGAYKITPERFRLDAEKIGRTYRFRALRTTEKGAVIMMWEAHGREECLAYLQRLPPNSIERWVCRHRSTIDAVIRQSAGPGVRIDDQERILWVENDEKLYLQAKACGVRFEE